MSVKTHIDGNRLVLEGSGVDFLKLKAELSTQLGPDAIRSESRTVFSLDSDALPVVQQILGLVEGGIPEDKKAEYEKQTLHDSARLKANQIIATNLASDISDEWLEILDPAQAVAVSAMTTKNLAGLCLFDEQGIGKTVMTIAAFDELHRAGEIKKLVIVAPVTMMQGWAEEIEKFLPGKYVISVLSGDKASKREKLYSKADVIVCNFESLTSLLVPMRSIVKTVDTLLAVDESFNVKNKDAVRSESVRELRRYCKRGYVMCGTPAPNSAIDVIHQFNIADNGYTFAGFTPTKDPEQLLIDISERIEQRGVYIRRLKSEVLPELPEKNFHVIHTKMESQQKTLYDDAKEKLQIELKSIDNATFKKNLTSYFQQRSALLQICACPQAVDPSYSETSIKLKALDKIVEDLVVKNGQKIVIWSFYKISLSEIFARYKQHNPVLLDGSVTAIERAEAVREFQSNSDTMICIANPAAAGAGVTLHAASHAVYVSFSNQAAHFLQSVDRIHRRGQDADSVHYHIIVCQDTLEEGEIKRLREKELRQQELLHDNEKWPNSLDEALAELQS